MTLDELRATAEPGRGGYRVFGGAYAQMSVTLEDAEFLYALVRLMKPWSVHEFGTGLGVSAKFILQGLLDNGVGEMYTVEPDAELRERARELLVSTGGCCMVVEPEYQRVGAAPEIVFIDSGYDRREADIAEWLSNGYQGLLVVHDANRDYEDLRGRGVLIPCTDGMWIGRGGGT